MMELLVFARAPRPGTVKRRLAADIGAAAALAFYRATLFDLARRLGRDPRWRARLVVTPDDSVGEPMLWPAGMPRIGQGDGDLGARMRRALAAAAAGPVVLVGSDVPELAPAHVAHAFTALARHDLAFGPSPDGGFWLVGAARRRPLPDRLFQGVRWSTAHALADTLATVPPDHRVALVDQLDDIDDGAAFRRWQARRETAQ